DSRRSSAVRRLPGETPGERRQLPALLPEAALLERPPVRPERVRGQDLRAGGDLVGMDRRNELRRFDERPSAPERQSGIGAAPLELGPHRGVQDHPPSAAKTLAKPASCRWHKK